VPRNHQPHRDPADAQRAAETLLDASGDDPSGHGQRHEADGQHEQHWHEDQLGRHRRAAPDLEVEPERGAVGGDEQQTGEPAGMAVRRDEQGKRRCGDDEPAREDEDRGQLAPRQPVQAARAPLFDRALLLRVEQERAGTRARRNGHGKQIDSRRARLDGKRRASLFRGIARPGMHPIG
jgi:hypothetical protein